LLLWLISAAWGVWIAYDKPAAWTKLWLIVGGLVLYGALVRIPERIYIGKVGEAPILEWFLGGLPVLVALYFFLTNDWASRIGKVPLLDPAMRWFAAWQPNLASLRLNSNVIGGVIAALLPLQIAALFQNRTRRRIWIGSVLVAVSGLGLLMSASRGAWLALAFVLIAWAARPKASSRLRTAIWASTVGIVLVSLVLFLVLTPLGERVLALRSDRLTVWRNSLDLASDYPFTGLGLGNFEMAYSSYVLLVHVGHTIHAHNLFLDMWLDQGLLGLLAFAGLLIQAVWPGDSISRWRIAGLASLAVIVLHGLLDDAFYGYGGWAIPFLLLPFAMLARPTGSPIQLPRAQSSAPRFKPAFVLWGVAAFLLLVTSFLPGMRAASEANLGALAQTRAELAVYRWPEWPFQDAVRRSEKVDLTAAITHYRAALALDPANATANRRLGQIELSFEQYDEATRHLSAAYTVAPGQRATRQLLGECYAINGDVDRAVALWKTVDTSQMQLELRKWWYSDYLGEQARAARLTQAIAALDKH
jgi:O-antigen ligase